MNELRTKLIDIGNPMSNIFTGDLNFPIIDWQMETADCGTHKIISGSSKCLFAIFTGIMLTAIYRGANEKK